MRDGGKKFQRICIGQTGESGSKWREQGQMDVAFSWDGRCCCRERGWHCNDCNGSWPL